MPENTSRKLASVRRIDAIEPIVFENKETGEMETAERIVAAVIGGWRVVTQKGWCEPGSLVCYFEIDSFLPVRPEFEFLRKESFKSTTNLGDGFRLKTKKLKGVVSQGLIMPIDEVFAHSGVPRHPLRDGEDLTDLLGIQLYEKPIPAVLRGQMEGAFPSYIRKTDQERYQNMKRELLSAHADKRAFQATLKLDGSSMTLFTKTIHEADSLPPVFTREMGLCSRNWQIKKEDDYERANTFWKTVFTEDLENKVLAMAEKIGHDLAPQGELMGPGVQNNREGFKTHHFFLYDIWDIQEQRYLEPHVVEDLASEFGVNHVPVISSGMTLGDLTTEPEGLMMALAAFAERKSINHPVAEGVVFKSMSGPRLSFKAISNTFLLKEKD